MKQPAPYSLLFWLFCISTSHAQTLNKGLLYVSPDTKFSVLDDLHNSNSGHFFNDGQTLLYGDLQNDGRLDYYLPGGRLAFIGIRPQQISGVQESYLYDVLFYNKSEAVPFRLSGQLLVNGLADFQWGIIDSDSYGGSFSFDLEGNHRNASDRSHVDGEVLKIGQGDFIYPVGDGGHYVSAGISDLNGSRVLSQGKYYLENSNEYYPHDSRSSLIEFIDDKQYWRIDKNTPGEVVIRLSWKEEVSPTAITRQQEGEALCIVRWDEEQQLWVDEGGALAPQGGEVSTIIEHSGIFALALKKQEQVLPCNMSIFNAITPNGDGINDYFRIEQERQRCAVNLHLQVFNRWGEKIYESRDYGNTGALFGEDSRRKLSEGTYFYRLTYELRQDAGAGPFEKAGYIHVSLD